MSEIELKLSIDPAQADLPRERLNVLFGAGKRVALSSTYFDTPDEALRKAGLTLRLRTVGKRVVQTVKQDAGHSAGLFTRGEWEKDIGGAVPDPAVFAETPVAQVLGANAALEAIFRTDVERTLWMIEDAGGRVEAALDVGRIVADTDEMAFAEMEFELQAGAPSMLFRLVESFGDCAGLRLGVRSKSECGYQLRDHADVRAVKAGKVVVVPGMSAGDALAAITRACLKHFRLNEASAADGHAESLHQARVALRRLRSALSLFKSLIDDPQSRRLRDELRWLAGSMGDARNIDVLLDRIDIDALHARLLPARDAAYRGVAAALGSARARLLIIEAGQWAEIGAWKVSEKSGPSARRDMPVCDFAQAALDRRHRRLRKAGADLTRLSPKKQHEVRIMAKKLRYAAEFFGPLFDDRKASSRRADFLTAVEDIQTHLGNLNDAETGQHLLAQLMGERKDDAQLLAQGLRRMHADSEAELEKAERACNRLFAIKRFWS